MNYLKQSSETGVAKFVDNRLDCYQVTIKPGKLLGTDLYANA